MRQSTECLCKCDECPYVNKRYLARMFHLIHCVSFFGESPLRQLSKSPKLVTSFELLESIECLLPVPKHIPNHTQTESFQRRTVFTARGDTEAFKARIHRLQSIIRHSSQSSVALVISSHLYSILELRTASLMTPRIAESRTASCSADFPAYRRRCFVGKHRIFVAARNTDS